MVLSNLLTVFGILRGTNGPAVRVGLSAALLVIGALLSTALPPSFLEGQAGSTQNTVVAPGYLLVSVLLDGGPLAGVSVVVSQVSHFGLRITLRTNLTGEVEFPLTSGQYGVSVTDPRFIIITSAPVFSGNITTVQVNANRTSYQAMFAAAQGAASAGQVETWDEIVVGVIPNGSPVYFGLWGLTGYPIFPAPANGTIPAAPRFGSEVFVQPIKYYLNYSYSYYFADGPEIPASVLSQVAGSGVTWLTLQPMRLLDLSEANYLDIVSYAASSTVSDSNV